MDCEQYREMISELCDGELSEPQKTELVAHLAVCPECSRVHDAFSALSSFITDDMAEPPESLCENVMAAARGHNDAKKRRRVWGRAAALAACLALVIFAGSRSGLFSAKGAAPRAASAMDVSSDAAPAPESEEPSIPSSFSLTSASSEPARAETSGSLSEELYDAAEAPESGKLAEANSGGAASALTELRVLSGDGALLLISDDEYTISSLLDMLAGAAEDAGTALPSTPDYAIEIISGGEPAVSVGVYIIEGRLFFLFGDGRFCAASASAEAFLALMQ